MRSVTLVLVVVSTCTGAGAVEVESVRWGAGGNLIAAGFQPVTVQLRNPGEVPEDGVLSLEIGDAVGRQVGVRLQRDVHLSPGARMLISFSPLVGAPDERWILSWNGERLPDASAKFAEAWPRTLVVLPPDRSGVVVGSALACVEAQFPDALPHLDGLHELVLYRAPELSDAQRQALRDWVAMGGVLTVLRRDLDGAVPAIGEVFPEIEEPLAGRWSFGTGSVREISDRSWLDFCRRQERDGSLHRKLPDCPGVDLDVATIGQNLSRTFRRQAVSVSRTGSALVAGAYVTGMLVAWHRFVRRRRQLARFMVMVPAGALACGVCFFLARATIDAPPASVSTVIYARVADVSSGARLDVVHWSFGYLAAGGSFTLDARERAGFASASNRVERLDMDVGTGVTSKIRATLPPFSFGEAVWREMRDAPAFLIAGRERDRYGWPVLRLGPGFPRAYRGVWAAMYGEMMWAQVTPDGVLRMTGELVESWQADATDLGAKLRGTLRSEIHSRMQESKFRRRSLDEPEPDTCDVFVEAEAPVEWLLDTGATPDPGRATILYHIRVAP